jgi:hypothetical protein
MLSYSCVYLTHKCLCTVASLTRGAAQCGRSHSWTPGVSVLVCGQASRPWRRELGAVAWAALEELALTANRDSKGWASPAGIRAIATGIGTTDIAALHAIAVLTRAGMVALGPLIDDQGRRRLAYRLFLLPGIDLRPGPSEHNELAPNRSGRLADTLDPPPPTTAGPRANSPDADPAPRPEHVILTGTQLAGLDQQGAGQPAQSLPHYQPSRLARERP